MRYRLPPDLHLLRTDIRTGTTSSETEMDRSCELGRSSACEHVFIQPTFAHAQAESRRSDAHRLPLAGLAVSVKDLFDVHGQITSAGSLALADQAIASADAPAVARLRRAGGVIVGRTNMTEFAFSGVGINPHYGTPINPADAHISRIPGGSSSGAAVSVATGAAHLGLGSDTGGSIRIPAALQGLVGFKSTAHLVPTQGALPLSKTLDTVCAITRSVRDAVLAHEILAARTVVKSPAPLAHYRLAVVQNFMQEGLDPIVTHAFERTLNQLRSAGADITEITLPALEELAGLNANGGLPAAESFAWHQGLLRERGEQYDPRVKARILRGSTMSACDYLHLQEARQDWLGRMQRGIAGFDAVLSPTVPIVAPPLAGLAPGEQRDDAFFRINALLLRNPSVVNNLDGCAISLPCHHQDELPVGLMLWSTAMRDDTVLNVAMRVEAVLDAHE